MGFNFRKSFSLGNGVRVTVGKKSASVSVGRKGVRGSISTTGRATGTVSIPGTGLSYSASKKISDLIPGGKSEEKKTTAKKTSAKTSSAKTTAAKSTAAKKTAAKTTAAKTTAVKSSAKKSTASKTTAAKTTASRTATAVKKATAAKAAAAKPAPEKTAPETPSNPFATGKAKKMSED